MKLAVDIKDLPLEDIQDPAAKDAIISLLRSIQTSAKRTIITVNANEPQALTWLTVAFQGAWVDYDTTVYNGVAYAKDQFGVVHLRGLCKNGAGGNIIILPAGYRPPKRCIFMCIADGAVSRVDVDAAGNVSQQTGTSGYLSLEGITFST